MAHFRTYTRLDNPSKQHERLNPSLSCDHGNSSQCYGSNPELMLAQQDEQVELNYISTIHEHLDSNWAASDATYDDRNPRTLEDGTQRSEHPFEEHTPGITTTQDEGPSELKANGASSELWQLPTRVVIQRDFWWLTSWVFDFILTLTPLCFIVAAAIALRLDHQPISDLGEKLLKASQLGPTVFPIIFAALIGRFCRNFSRWLLERPQGIKLGVLEQINGSQSLSSAIEKVFTVRSTKILPLCIVLVWALSPVGGQSSLRLFTEGQDSLTSNSEVYYANPEYQASIFDSASGAADYSSAVNMVYSSVLFSVPSKRAALTDPWDRPKLPQLSQDVINGSDFSWQDFDHNPELLNGDDFASLLGLNIQGLRTDDPTMIFDFNIETAYIDMDCERVTNHTTPNMTYSYSGQASSFVASLQNYTASGDPDSWFWNIGRTGHRLYYDSRISYTARQSNSRIALFECVMRRVPIEAELRCGPFPSVGCSVRRQRQREDKFDPISSHISSDGWIPPDNAYQILPWTLLPSTLPLMLQHWPAAAGQIDPIEEASATDNFLAGDGFLYDSQRLRDWDHDVTDIALFSRRMTTLFNTMFHASLNAWNVTKVDMTQLPEPDLAADDIFNFYYNTTQATVTQKQDVYLSNRAWCVILIVIGTILQLLAIADIFLRATTNAPDILGFASSLTRDNPYFPIQPSGSALGGLERTRLLKDVRVQIADVVPANNVGYIAFRPIPFEEVDTQQKGWDKPQREQLRWPVLGGGKRLYA